MIRFRKDHIVLRKNTKICSLGFPFVSYHGMNPWHIDYQKEDHYVGILFAGRDEKDEKDDIVYLAVNTYWEPQMVNLPQIPESKCWTKVVDTYVYEGEKKAVYGIEGKKRIENNETLLQPRSVQILVIES